MKICFALPPLARGGSYTFLANFQAYLTEMGQPWTNDLDGDYDILFFNSWTIPYATLLKHKKRLPNVRLVQRVDGAAQDYGRFDGVDVLQADANRLADKTIFQSQYSYEATHQRYGVIRQTGPIIYNPVDINHFIPDGTTLALAPHPKRVITVGWSSNPLKGNQRIIELAKANPDVEFLVVGVREDLMGLANIRRIAYLSHDELPTALRSAHAYLSLLENDASPNVITEALSIGLPVVYLPSGGVPEIVRGAGATMHHNEDFPKALQNVLVRHDEFSRLARRIAVDYHAPDKIFSAYLAEIASAKRRDLPPKATNWRATVNFNLYNMRLQIPKWRRILTGQQSLFKER